MMDLHQLDERINDAGVDTTAMHELVLQLDQRDPKVEALRIAIENHGAKLSSIQGCSDALKAGDRAQPVLRPGTAVGDVGGNQDGYTGPINALTLTLGNLAYIDRHLGSFSDKWGQVFNGKVRFPDQQGVLSNAEPNPQTPDGFDLGRYAFP